MKIIKDIGTYVLGFFILLIVIAIPVFFIWGGVRLGNILLPWLYIASWLVLAIDIIIFLPLCIFKKTRPYAGVGYYISSYIIGATVWFLGLLLTYTLWGGTAVLIGLFLMGIGVVPIAMVATLFKGMWGPFGSLILLIILTFGIRIFGLYLAEQENL